jgi:hypothetical protein
MSYEYRVVPAPKRLKRRKGVSSTTELFAATLAECINAEAAEGWEYVRAESLAAEEPAGWFRRAGVVEETMLIFRRRRMAPHVESGEPRETAEGPRRHALLARRGPAPQERQRAEPRAATEAHAPRPADAAPPLLRPVPRNGRGEKK